MNEEQYNRSITFSEIMEFLMVGCYLHGAFLIGFLIGLGILEIGRV